MTIHVRTRTWEDIQREFLGNSAKAWRRSQQTFLEKRDFERAALCRTNARKEEARLRRLNGCCGECGRPHERDPRNPANLPVTPTGTWIDPP